MVTTIKITCDGVFIQTNPFLNPTTTATNPTESAHTLNATTEPTTIKSDATINDAVDGKIKCKYIHQHHKKTLELNCVRKLGGTNSGHKVKSISLGHKVDNRRRYYFGSNNLFCCKHSPNVFSSCSSYKNNANRVQLPAHQLTRSASLSTPDELEIFNKTNRTHKKLSSSLSLTNHSSEPPAIKQDHNKKYNSEFKCNLEQKQEQLQQQEQHKTITGKSSIFLETNYYKNASTCNSNNNNNNNVVNSSNENTKLLNFLRSARKLYNNSTQNNNNSNNNNNNNGHIKVNHSELSDEVNNYNNNNHHNNDNNDKQENVAFKIIKKCFSDDEQQSATLTVMPTLASDDAKTDNKQRKVTTYLFGDGKTICFNNQNAETVATISNNNNNNNINNNTLIQDWFDEDTATVAKEQPPSNTSPTCSKLVSKVLKEQQSLNERCKKAIRNKALSADGEIRKSFVNSKQQQEAKLKDNITVVNCSCNSATPLNIKTNPAIARKLEENLKDTLLITLASATNNTRRKENVMNSHVTATQNGQTSVVGHHRGFSQPSATASTAGDPWFLQSTGHQMPPTAPLRHNKRPAPQPNSIVTGSVAINTSSAVNSGNILLNANTVNSATALLQQQLSQSQPHIVTSANLSTHHHNNVNQHHHHNAIHLSSHALNSHNLITNVAGGIVTSNNSPKSPNQQQPQQQQHTNHIMSTFAPIGSTNERTVSATTAAAAAAAAAAASINCNNNLMSSSLNAVHSGIPLHERGLPPKSMLANAVGGSNMLLHSQAHVANQQTGNMVSQAINTSTNNSGMSTSLHSFDLNGGVGNGCNVVTNAPHSWTSSSLSPTTGMAVNQSALLHAQQQQPLPHKKCEVKLNAMPWFHGSITRDEAEHLLQPREDGLFLVRESTNFPGDYTLCVCFQGKVEHYRVKYLENKLTIDDEEYFENLGQLVAHYEADADGLCTQLVKCLPKQGRQEFCINSKDFIDKGWVIPESDLQLRESIGKGEFGDVLLGILRNEKVAVKMLKDEGAVQKFLAEASVMTTLEHENLVKFIGLVYTSKHIYLVTEYMSKGSLVDYLRSRGRQHITKKDQINFAYDTASGMEYLEAKKVVHRDLAARNVLISEECVAKVSDFGLAREECYNLDVGKLPIKWTAPEALKNGRFSNKSDMWSFGILLWEIYSFGRVPYPRIPLADVVKHVEVGYKMEAPEGCPNEIYEMMRQAWDLNPAKRPTFAELKVKLLHLKNTTT